MCSAIKHSFFFFYQPKKILYDCSSVFLADYSYLYFGVNIIICGMIEYPWLNIILYINTDY